MATQGYRNPVLPYFGPTHVPDGNPLMRTGETVERASRRLTGSRTRPSECPGPAKRFGKALYYAPVTWWVGNLTTLGMEGMFGHSIKRQSHLNHTTLAQILWHLYDDPRKRTVAREIIAWYTRNNKAGFAGRLVGSAFTTYASQGGRGGRRHLSGKIKVSSAIANFVIATYGTGILAVSQGRRAAQEIVPAMLIGDPDSAVRCLPPLGDLDIDLDDFAGDPKFQANEAAIEIAHAYMMYGWDIFDE